MSLTDGVLAVFCFAFLLFNTSKLSEESLLRSFMFSDGVSGKNILV